MQLTVDGDHADVKTAFYRRLQTSTIVFWVAFTLVAAFAMIKLHYLFTTTVTETGDQAVNSLSVQRALDFHQLEGNYSRVGFRHPGPAFFYILAAGQFLFYSVLHVAAGPYNGQILGLIVYTAVILAFVTRLLYRWTNSLPATAIAFAIIWWFASGTSMIGANWFPDLYMPAFLLMTVAAAAVAAGRTTELPGYVLGASLLAHGHVSFLAFVSVTTVAVAVGWFLSHRGGLGAELRAKRRAVIIAAVVVALFLVPMVADIVLHYPGQWGYYYRFVTHGNNAPRTVGSVWSFFAWYWTNNAISIAVIAAAAVLAVVLLLLDKNQLRRRYFLVGYLFLLLETALFLFYIFRGVDRVVPGNRYVGFFYLTVPLLLVVAAVVHLFLWSRERLPERVPGKVPAAIAAALVIVAVITTTIRVTPWGPTSASTAAFDAVSTAAHTAGEPVALEMVDTSTWAGVAAIAIQAKRAGVSVCVVDTRPLWVTMFMISNICPGTAGHLVVRAQNWHGEPVPPGATVVWQGKTAFVGIMRLTTST